MVAPIIKDQEWDAENDFELDTHVRNQITAYYGDFVSGTYKTLPFGVSSAASRYNEDVDMKLFAGFDYSTMFWLSNKDGIEEPQDFEGETVAAPLASGSYQVANAVVTELTGQSVEDLASNTINASGPSNPLLEVANGNATVALSWEPALSSFLVQNDSDIRTVMNVRERYREAFDAESFHLVWAVRSDVLENNRAALEGLVAANQQVGELYADDPEEAIDIVVENTESSKEPLLEAVESGRQEFVLQPLSEIQSDVQTQFEVYADTGVIDEVPDDGIFADI